MITFEYLKQLNDSGELPKNFTDEELRKIVEAESMVCGFGCSFCPMAQFEMGNITPIPVDIENKKQDSEKPINTEKGDNDGNS